VIDLTNETILTLSEARGRLPRRRQGKRPDLSTLYRWATRGLRGIVLETIQVGGTACTSLEALQRFFDRLTAARTRPGAAASILTPKQRARRQQRTEQDLAKVGL